MLLDFDLDDVLPVHLKELTQGQTVQKCTRLISYYLKMLGYYCDRRLILSAQKSLMIFRSLDQNTIQNKDDFFAALRNSDTILGEEWGGFSRLLASAVDEGEIDFEAENIFFQLPEDTSPLDKTFLETSEKLTILHEIADSFLIASSTAAAGCIVLDGVYFLLQNRYQNEPGCKKQLENFLWDWLKLSTCTPVLGQLWQLRLFTEEISAQVLQELEEITKVRDFCLWFLSNRLFEKKAIEGFTRRLVDTLLARAELAPLSVFESAGLLP